MANPQTSQNVDYGRSRVAESSQFRIVNMVPPNKQALDHALEETFPASDPVSITISVVVRVVPIPEFLN